MNMAHVAGSNRPRQTRPQLEITEPADTGRAHYVKVSRNPITQFLFVGVAHRKHRTVPAGFPSTGRGKPRCRRPNSAVSWGNVRPDVKDTSTHTITVLPPL